MKLAVSLAAIAATLLFSQAHAATLTVNSTADAGGTCPGADCTLRQAIATAVSGDTINFAAGITTIDLTSGPLTINKNLIISGPGANLLSVQRSAAAGNFRIVDILFGNFNVTISGLTIANGNVPGSTGGGIRNFDGSVTITKSTISGNTAATQGGGIYNAGTLIITNSTISGNTASNGDGGGILNSGTLTITNSTISGNSASSSGGGGIYNISGSVTTTNSTISGNTASSAGGGIWNAGGGTLNSRNTIIVQNTSPDGPDLKGALTSQGFNLIGFISGQINNVQPSDQLNVTAPQLGSLQDNGGPTRTHALLSGSPAIERGHSSGSNTDQRGLARPVVIPGSTPVGDGSDIGAYEVQADLLPGCNNINRIVNNNNDSGTGSLRFVIANVCAGSTITFAPNVTGAINLTSGELLINKPLTINGPGANLLSVQRGAGAPNFRIFNIAPASVIATISGLTIANGNAPGTNGGGIYNTATLTLTNSSVIGNGADFSNGGGIFNDGVSLTLTNSTISGNTASGSSTGGGIGNTGGTVTITNSTISGNTVSGSFSCGGGILNNSGTITITNSTISGNSAPGSFSGGGINNGGTVRARNTIIALNTSPTGPDVNGALTSENFNLIGNNSGATITPAQFSDQIGTAGSPINPMLGPLQNNGGPTLTRALLTGSPAIDKGHSSGSTTDQRGFPRTFDDPAIPNAIGGDGDGTDIGATELFAPFAVSRKLHGAAAFGINLPLTGTAGIECRGGGVNNDHQVIMTFPSLVTVTSTSVTTGTGSVSNSAVSGGQVTVNLTGVTNAQTLVLTLFGVNNGTTTSDVTVPMGVLLSDTNGNGSVSASDIAQTKAQSGQAAIATNFRTDVNVSGSISAADISLVKSKAGTSLP